MLCEGIVLLKDKDFGDTTKNWKAGDFVSLKTEEEIRTKWSELLKLGLLDQRLIDVYTNIGKPFDQVDAGDFLTAELHWPYDGQRRP